jgi:predicted NBD/HSP70 family sugar kinase
MFYVGLDIHSKHISVCVLNEAGKFLHRTRVRTIDEMMRILERLTIDSKSAMRRVVGTVTSTICCVLWPRGY